MRKNTRNSFLINGLIIFMVCFGAVLITERPVRAFNEVKYVRDIGEHLKKPVDAVVSSDGDIYVLDRNQSRVFVFNEDGQIKLSFGERGSLNGQLYNPESLTLNHEGEVIVADTGNARVNVYSLQGHFRYQLGGEGQVKGKFEKPVSIAVNQRGYIYVADGHLDKIVKYSPKGVFLDEIHLPYKPLDIIFDNQDFLYVLSSEQGIVNKYEDGKLIKEMAFLKDDINLLDQATGISIDENGDMYFITLAGHSIYKFNQSQELIYSFGSQGAGRGQFKIPSGIFYRDGYAYVPDTNNQRLQIFAVKRDSPSSSEISLGERKEPLVEFVESIHVSKFISDLMVLEDNAFYALSDYKGCLFKNAKGKRVLGLDLNNRSDLSMPQAFKVKASGEIIVADTKNNRVQFLNEDGSYGYKFGKKGKNQSQFNQLQGIAIHKDGYVYVADTNNHRIQIFNRDGIYLKSFGEKSLGTKDDNPAPGTFLEPKSLEFDSQGNLFVLDYRNKRIQVFDPEGVFMSQIGADNNGDSFSEPVDIAIDENDYLYVADRGDHSIKIYGPRLNFIYKFGSDGKGPSYFPRLSAVDATENRIYVADYNLEEVKVFSFNEEPNKKKAAEVLVKENKKAADEVARKDELVGEELDLQKEAEEEQLIDEVAISQKKDPEKFFLSRVTYALGYINLPYEAKLMLLRKDLEQNASVPPDRLKNIQIEREEKIDNEMVRIIVSVPKE